MVNFGIQIEPPFGFTYEDIKSLAFECKSLGFDTMWCSDHLFLDGDSVDRNCLDCFTLLAALAVDTQRLRLGSMTACVSYRYPSMLAKIAACVDVMSGGRLEFGIGAGWKKLEYEAYGIPFPPAGQRVSQLEEAIRIIQLMWTQERATFEGRYYQIKDAFCSPKPLKKPHPTIWVGGSKPRVLRIAAELGGGINIGGFPTLQEYRTGLDMLKEYCQRLGRPFGEIKKSHFTGITIAKDETQLDRRLQGLARDATLSVDEYVKRRRKNFIGTPEACVEYLQQYVDLGVSSFTFMFPYGHEMDSLRTISETVLPNF